MPPEGIVEENVEPVAIAGGLLGIKPVLSLDGHRRKILSMEYNPTASEILATGSRCGIGRGVIG